MDRCDEVFQRVYETMFEQTDDPLPDVVPVTRELRCQMLQQHLRHSRSAAYRLVFPAAAAHGMRNSVPLCLADSAQGAGGAGHYGRGRRKMR